ncbi:MAG: XRE family transcriptional regulator, partial [Tepidanaerobacteraceae bacterium]
KLSQPLANLIEEKYGYNAHWILTGKGSKLRQVGKNPDLSHIHKKAIMRIEKMSDEQIKAVLAFIKYLEEVEQDLTISNRDVEG